MRETLLNDKITQWEVVKDRKLTDKEIKRCSNIVNRSIQNRLKELTMDYEYCEDVLFNDNIWLQLLDVNGEFLKSYLNKLPQETKDQLAVVPKWNTRDHSLGRAYINDDFNYSVADFK